MREFDELLQVADRLLGPGGCPWDHSQNFFSLQPYVLEEAHEVVEAVDAGDDHKIFEELGDLLYTVIFYSKIAEKEKRFTIENVLNSIKEKLIRRHPHIFGEGEAKDADEVVKRWEEIKKQEKGHEMRKSALDGVPERLPLIPKAQKVVKKVLREHFLMNEQEKYASEKEVGDEIMRIIIRAESSNIDVESALRRSLNQLEKAFREWESKKE